jgi:Tol biopolymer transport system component
MDDTHKDRGPRWASDGKLLLFYSNRGGRYDIWRIRPDGTDAQRLTNSMDLGMMTCIPAPDGKSFACTAILDTGWAMFIFEPTSSLESLSDPLPVPESGIANFDPIAFSPDGKYIAVGSLTGAKPMVGVFSLETKKVTQVKTPGGGNVFMTQFSGGDWIDGNRFIGWNEMRATAYIYDVEKDETREVEGIQGPCDIRVVEEGKALVVNRTRQESDIWMLTLGTIDKQPAIPKTGEKP